MKFHARKCKDRCFENKKPCEANFVCEKLSQKLTLLWISQVAFTG